MGNCISMKCKSNESGKIGNLNYANRSKILYIQCKNFFMKKRSDERRRKNE